MISQSKKLLIFGVLLLLAIGAFVAVKKINQTASPSSVDTDENVLSESEIEAKDWDTIGVYHNPVYRYSVDYPATNFSIDSELSEKDSSSVVFSTALGNGDSRHISFNVNPTTNTDPHQILERLGLKEGQAGVDKDTIIDGYPAVVTHWVWDNGTESPDIKAVFFIKDGYEYSIGTEYVDHERIWKSFRFDK
jgi:hypothetical protein